VVKKPLAKKPESLREKALKATNEKPKPRRLQKTASKVTKPLGKAKQIGQKSYFIPLPNNKVGNFLNKPRRFTPRYFRDAWAEVRQVQWPNRKETTRLTIAVFIFAITFGVSVALLDYGLDKLFENLLLK
jgi:preprotein translocase SecE subunit